MRLPELKDSKMFDNILVVSRQPFLRKVKRSNPLLFSFTNDREAPFSASTSASEDDKVVPSSISPGFRDYK